MDAQAITFNAQLVAVATAVKLAFDTAAEALRRIIPTLARAAQGFSQLAGFLLPSRTRSGRWRVRLVEGDRWRTAVYRTRALALAALRRSLSSV